MCVANVSHILFELSVALLIEGRSRGVNNAQI